jgi:uncharacterized protein
MSRIIAALFLCFALAPIARAQSFDCATATGVLQRVCAAPELIPLEEERRQLIDELQFNDPAHPAIQGEAAWVASQEACADAACLAAGYATHNQELRAALDALRPPETELAPEPTPAAPSSREADTSSSSSLDDAPAVQPNEYLFGAGVVLITLLIAFWLLSSAGRARRRDRGE